jgi:hypothetical protein
MWPGLQAQFVLGAESSPEVFQAVQDATAPPGLTVFNGGLHLAEEMPTGHQPWSDYDAFRNHQVPTVFVSNGQNKYYHTPQDEMSIIDRHKLAREGQHTLALVTNLANLGQTPQFDQKGADYLNDAVTIVDCLDAALAEGGIIDSLGLSESSRQGLAEHLKQVKAIRDKLLSAQDADDDDIKGLRNAVQHIMCLSGAGYDQILCNWIFEVQ